MNDIDDSETVVRIIRAPQFVKKNGALAPAALRPQREFDRVSIVRWLCRERPDEVFKARCQKVGSSGKNAYAGLSVSVASDCRAAGVMLEDAPDEFPGHAHLVFPFAVPYQEPVEGEMFRTQVEISNRLLAITSYIPDPEPSSSSWTIQDDRLALD